MGRSRRASDGPRGAETPAFGAGAHADRRAERRRGLPGIGPDGLRALGLTRRAVAVLELVARGDTNAKVAGQLRISPLTVKTDLERMYARTGVGNRAELVALAWERAPAGEGMPDRRAAERAPLADQGRAGDRRANAGAVRRRGRPAAPAPPARDRRSAGRRRLPGLDPAALGALGLTRREITVLEPVAGGRTNEQIAASLGLSPLTVKKHLDRVSAKLGASHRAALVAATRQRLRQGGSALGSGRRRTDA